MQKVWLVVFPTYKYKEDVKDLARRNNLKIINAKFKHEINPDYVEAKPPKLTLKPEYQPKKEATNG